MTRKEFEKLRMSVEREPFQTNHSSALDYGIHRNLFRKEKLKRLIAAGRQVDSQTVRAKVETWKRQLKRLDESHHRLERLKKEFDAARLQVRAPEIDPVFHQTARRLAAPRA